MKQDTENRNLPNGWTGNFLEIDLSKVSDLPGDSLFEAILLVDHPSCRRFVGLQIHLSRDPSGRWTIHVVKGHVDGYSGGWVWEDPGDWPEPIEQPIHAIVDELELRAERELELVGQYDPDPTGRDLHPAVRQTLVDHLAAAADHLSEAYQRAQSAKAKA